jgi:hypothetical protein
MIASLVGNDTMYDDEQSYHFHYVFESRKELLVLSKCQASIWVGLMSYSLN